MSPEQLRKEALKRVKAKKNFWSLFGVFVIIWIILIVIWALSSKDSEKGLAWSNFWPIWPIFGMGIALLFTGWGAYGPQDTVSEAQIEAEMRKMQDGR